MMEVDEEEINTATKQDAGMESESGTLQQEHNSRKAQSQTATPTTPMVIPCTPRVALGKTRSLQNSSDSDTASGRGSNSDYYMAAVNKTISMEQLRLNNRDRISINEEIHGVPCQTQEESPEFLRLSLKNLSLELSELVQKDNVTSLGKGPPNGGTLGLALSTGYQMSQCSSITDNNTYVNSAEFRLRFLRCENFDTKQTAIRLMKYLNLLIELFGLFALYRPIELTDFSKPELKFLQSGWLQVLPFRDRGGRRVFILTGALGFNHDPILRIKLSLYVFLAATRDAETQQKGAVMVAWTQSFAESPSGNDLYFSLFRKLLLACPIKICSLHFCFFSPRQGHVLSLLCKMFLALGDRLISYFAPRTKFHFGDVQDRLKILSGYGILGNLIPVTNSGVAKTIYFKQWLKLQRRIDDKNDDATASSFIDCPRSNDVLFRSGSTMFNNPGNVMFRGLVEAKIQDVYLNSDSWTSWKTKDCIALEIIEEVVQEKRGRFLGWDSEDDCWKEFEDMVPVKAKIAVTYRDLKLKLARMEQQQQQQQQQQMSP